MNTKPLEELGLTNGEIKVYLALLRLGETTSGPLGEESEISVSKIYSILERLARRGLVSHIVKRKVKYFQAADPGRLLDYIREKENKLAEQETSLKEELIPQLKLMGGTAITEETAQVFDGLKGIQTARERTLHIMKKGEEMWIIGIADRKSTRLNSSHMSISYAVFCLKKKKK